MNEDGRFSGSPYELESISYKNQFALLDFTLPNHIGQLLALEANVDQIAIGSMIEAAVQYVNIGEQIDGYKVENGNGKIVASFSAEEPEPYFEVSPGEFITQYEAVAVRQRFGMKLDELANKYEVTLSSLICAGLETRMTIRRYHAANFTISAMRLGKPTVLLPIS